MRSLYQVACATCAYFLTGQLYAGTECKLPSAADVNWMSGTLKQWQETASEALGLADTSLPWIIFFDATCSWNINAPAQDIGEMIDASRVHSGEMIFNETPLPIAGYTHDGEIVLPEGGTIPPQLILFTSTYGSMRASYMVMAMPEIWRVAPHHANEPASELDRLIRSVFVHEMVHTAQSSVFGRRLDAITEKNRLNDDEVSDDMIQHRFADNSAFSDSVDQERKLLFDAANTDDRTQARALVSRAVGMIRQRHAKWLSGENAHLAELEDIFFYMEGAANWAAYQALLDQGMTPEQALPVLRRGGRWWTQDEGLAIFLAIDHLLPGWQARAMSGSPGSVLDLLEEAAAVSNRH